MLSVELYSTVVGERWRSIGLRPRFRLLAALNPFEERASTPNFRS